MKSIRTPFFYRTPLVATLDERNETLIKID